MRYSPMRVALASAEDGCGSGSCKYVPGVLQDIVVQLLCAGVCVGGGGGAWGGRVRMARGGEGGMATWLE